MKKLFALLFLSVLSGGAHSSQTWVLLGDSIMSGVADGRASQLATHLVAAERNVVIKSIAAPGNSLGSTDHTGYNNSLTVAALALVGGPYSAYNGIIIQAGTNDYGRSIPYDQTIAGLRVIMNHARALNKRVLLLDPIWRAGEDNPNALGHTLNVYRWVMAVTCIQEYGDICRYAPRGDTVMGSSAGAANYAAAEVAAGAQLHPNAQGHRLIADWIIRSASGIF